jgi:hypothetical protein
LPFSSLRSPFPCRRGAPAVFRRRRLMSSGLDQRSICRAGSESTPMEPAVQGRRPIRTIALPSRCLCALLAWRSSGSQPYSAMPDSTSPTRPCAGWPACVKDPAADRSWFIAVRRFRSKRATRDWTRRRFGRCGMRWPRAPHDRSTRSAQARDHPVLIWTTAESFTGPASGSGEGWIPVPLPPPVTQSNSFSSLCWRGVKGPCSSDYLRNEARALQCRTRPPAP